MISISDIELRDRLSVVAYSKRDYNSCEHDANNASKMSEFTVKYCIVSTIL